MELVSLVLGLGAIFLGGYWLYLRYRNVPPPAPENGKLTPQECRLLINAMGTALSKGIRASLGLDLKGEVINTEPETDPAPIYVKELEMDPWMREIQESGLEWPNVDTILQKQEQNESKEM